MNRRDVYVIVPLTPAKGWCTLNRDGTPPLSATPSCYPSCLLTHAQHVVNLFHPYANVLAFAVGNEILNSGARWAAAGCVKGFTRDVKRFLRRCEAEESSRRVPLLYAAADNAMVGFSAEENDRLKADYLSCGDDEDARIDVMGVNLFRFCSDSCTFHSCESNKVAAAFSTAQLPMLLTEYGCGEFAYHANHTQRPGVNPFTETALLYSPLMSGAFSGGCAYTYGVRGGESFAFYSGGGRSVSGEAGLEKRCGYPDGLCRVDAYEKQLAALEERDRQREERRRRARLAGEAEEQLDNSDGGGDGDGAATTCPVLLGVDLTVADSRQGADGYEEVVCQAGVGRSATAGEERERQERVREQQRLDDSAKEEQKKKLAKQEEEEGDGGDTDADQPAADTPDSAERRDAGQQQQRQQQQNASQPLTSASQSHANASTPSHQPERVDASGGGAQERGQGEPAEKNSAAAKRHLRLPPLAVTTLCALVATFFGIE